MVMSKIITIAGQKGGTGKTTTAVNLAASLALLEKNTLLVDLDPKGVSTQWCGISDQDYNCDISLVLSGRATFKTAIIGTQINHLDMIPSDFGLFPVGLKLAKKPGNEKMLYLMLEDIKDEYDYIIIDSPSSYEFLSVTAMTAAQWLLVCMTPSINSRDDFHHLIKMVKHIRNTCSVPLKISGFLFNRCNNRQEIDDFLLAQNLTDISSMVFKSFIPEDKKFKKAIDLGMPLALHDIKSPAASAYLQLSEELNAFLQ